MKTALTLQQIQKQLVEADKKLNGLLSSGIDQCSNKSCVVLWKSVQWKSWFDSGYEFIDAINIPDFSYLNVSFKNYQLNRFFN